MTPVVVMRQVGFVSSGCESHFVNMPRWSGQSRMTVTTAPSPKPFAQVLDRAVHECRSPVKRAIAFPNESIQCLERGDSSQH
jgi:hypothetical protein